MESGKTLSNDFAPAWLKIPNQEIRKPIATTDRRLFVRSMSEKGGHNYGNGIDMWDYFSSTPNQRTRNNRNGSINGNYSNGHHSGHRINSRRDNSNSRSSPENDCANTEWSQKDLIPALNDLQYRVTKFSRGKSNGSKHKLKECSSLSIDDEFPSLSGDVHIDVCNKPLYSKVASVWDGPARELNNKSRASSANSDSSPKTLILKSNMLKRPCADADKLLSSPSSSHQTSTTSYTHPHPKINVSSTSQSRSTQLKEPQSPVITSAKVLTACIKHSKEAGDRKSNFFKLMKRETHDCVTDVNDTAINCHTNPIADDDDDDDDDDEPSPNSDGLVDGQRCNDKVDSAAGRMPANNSHESWHEEQQSSIEVVLSSSFEAERKLLREMGWNETENDNDDYEITEEEMKDFEALCVKLKEQNGGVSGLRRIQSKSVGAITSSPISACMSAVAISSVDSDSGDVNDSDLSDS